MKQLMAAMVWACVFAMPVCGWGQKEGAAATPTAKAVRVPEQQFALKFVAKEVEGGRVVNTREYTLRSVAGSGGDRSHNAQSRTGSRVPVVTGAGSQQYTYLDVGVSFDCTHVEIVGDRIQMDVKAEISSYNDSSPGIQPVIHQNKWEGSVEMPIGKTDTIFSSDDVVSKRTLQVDLTVLPIR